MMKDELADIDLKISKEEVLNDYRIAVESREVSLLGRKEVFMGKAKFGIFGDGKEVPQLAMARHFQNGDWRAGYYRDQTFMMAIGETNLHEYFAQLYAHADIEHDPHSGGRMMNCHYSSRLFSESSEWLTQTDKKNTSADVSSTASQMPKLVGLGYASKLYRENKQLSELQDFSINGNEVAFGTIGNASTSEGHFWEAMNAIGVMQLPVVMSVWDDDYGISVGKEYHTVKESISEALAGFQREDGKPGFEIFVVRGWDYPELLKTYKKATNLTRTQHIPTLVHVIELTQPQGHSTSGSHERYKPKERLDWEQQHDCILKMREWLLTAEIATEEELNEIEQASKKMVKDAKSASWKSYLDNIKQDVARGLDLIEKVSNTSNQAGKLNELIKGLRTELTPEKNHIIIAARKALRYVREEQSMEKEHLKTWLQNQLDTYGEQFSSKLYDDSKYSALNIATVPAQYSEKSELVDGREILNMNFDRLLAKDPRIFAIGEDVGQIGDVNQGFAGLQEKYGELRVSDTSIRELTIMGQAIGTSLRGLRPIAEIQYLDYLIYGLQQLSDEVASLQYRTGGGQKAPLIVRTRGHRLEGIWHSGSPLGMMIHSLRGMYILSPRNMTQAAGFYNTLLQSDDPAIIIESLNGYRLKERIPENMDEFQLALGEPEILKEGNDITIVTYGSCCRIVMEAANQLLEEGIDVEVIDAQTLIPFDRPQTIVASLSKTNKLIIVDEDVPGGASGYILQQILERDKGYLQLDSQPITVTGKDHRPAYGSDGDYFSKPNVEDVFDAAYNVMNEYNPERFKSIY